MNNKRGDWRALVVVLLAMAAIDFGLRDVVFVAAPAPHPVPAASTASALHVKGAAIQPAGLPVIVELTLTNIRKEAIYYWCGGPNEYPMASLFTAEVTPIGVDGRVQATECINGQCEMGSGDYREINPGASVKVPLAIATLPVGRYEIVFESLEMKETDPWTGRYKTVWPAARSPALHIAIQDDAVLADAVSHAWAGQILGGDWFAISNATQWRTPAVIAKLVPALAWDDDTAVRNAAEVLESWVGADFPAGAGAAAAKGIKKRLRRHNEEGVNPNMLMPLTVVAGNAGSDEALVAVEEVVHSAAATYARPEAVRDLSRFHQPHVSEELEGLMKDEDDWVRSAAAVALAERGNKSSLPVLMKLIERDVRFRASHMQAFAHFPNDPQAVAAIQAAQRDPDAAVRQLADRAWEDVTAARAKPVAQPSPK